MNGKIKTKFAALFAVALMITVCVVPVVGNEGVQAADVSSTIPEGISDIEIQMFTEDSTDFSDLIYCANGSKLPASVDPVEWKQVGTTGCFINVNKDSEYFGKYLRFGQTGLSNDEIIKLGKEGSWLPLIQTSWMYSGGDNLDVTIDGPKDVTDATGPNADMTKAGVVFEEVEYVSSIKFYGSYSPSWVSLGFGESLLGATGEYKVKVSLNDGVPATTGAVIAEEKFSFESEKDLLSIKGTVTDAGTTKIKGAKVAYKVGNDAGTAITDADGKYEIKFKSGSVVEITGITYGNGEYTFNGGYVFGTLTTPVTNGVADFKANESTFKMQIVASGVGIPNETITAGWYVEYANVVASSATQTYNISQATTGKATLLTQKTDDAGYIYVTYKVPSDITLPTGVSSQTKYLVVSGVNSNYFTYETVSISTGTSVGKSVNSQVDSSKTGMKVFANTPSDSSISPKESLATVYVKDKGATNPVAGATVSAYWYSDKPNATDSSKSDVAQNPAGGKAVTVGKTDKDGKVYVAYITPTAVSDTTFYLYVSESTSDAGYTFDVKSITVGTGVTPVGSQSLTTGSEVQNSTFNNYSIDAKEDSWYVSGTVTVPGVEIKNGKGPELTISYTNGIGSSVKYDVPTPVLGQNKVTYTYGFYILDGKSSVITPTLKDYKFTPVSFTTNTAKANISGVNFTAKSTVVETKYNPTSDNIGSVSVGGFASTDVGKLVVDLTYDVNGKQYTTPVLVTESSPNFVATYNVAGVAGTYVELVSASAENYQFSLNANGKLTAGSSKIVTFFLSDAQNKPVKGVELTIFDTNKKELGVIKSDDKGLATLEVGSGLSIDYVYGVFDGLYKVPFTVSELGYWAANVQNYAEAETATVEIVYGSTFNNNTEYPGELDWSAIGGDNVEKAIGSKLDLKAPSIDGFEFVAWMVDGVVVSDKADYTLVVPAEGCDAVALYSAVHYEEPAEGLSMNVLVIGIVILILGILAVAYGIISKKQ